MSKKPVENNILKKASKIMVFGTFDGLHAGHIDFFKQAKKLSPLSFLVVSVARNKNVLKIKGTYPRLNEHQRAQLIRKSNLADKVVLSGIKNYLPHIVKVQPDIIALGYDQIAYVSNLKKDLKNEGISARIVRLKPYKHTIYKNHLLKLKR